MDDSRAVAQINEREPTKIPTPVDPATESNMLSSVAESKVATEVCTMGCGERCSRHQKELRVEALSSPWSATGTHLRVGRVNRPSARRVVSTDGGPQIRQTPDGKQFQLRELVHFQALNVSPPILGR